LNTIDSEDKIEALEDDYLYISPSQIHGAGNGLFTAVTIYKGEDISIFKGEILTIAQATERANIGKDKYFIMLLDGTILDCMETACFAKYANDAKGLTHTGFKNNTKITLDDDNNVCLSATRNIKAGEEIFCSYGNRYWKKHGHENTV
jgi:uncharacterized protein